MISAGSRLIETLLHAILGHWEESAEPAAASGLPSAYRQLLDRWNDSRVDLSPLLDAACEERLALAEDQDQLAPGGELGDHFYGVFPAELLALQRLRALRGMESIPAQHPLMTMPLGTLRDMSGREPMEQTLSALALQVFRHRTTPEI